MKRLIFLHILAFMTHFVVAQNTYIIGFLPQVNTEISFSDRWKLNTKLEARQIITEGHSKNLFNGAGRYERTDLEMIVNRNLGAQSAVGLGYLIRLEEGKFIHRFIQQYSVVQKFTSFRLAHRFRTDETFENDEYSIVRARYRASLEKPLNGQSVDPKEFYLKLNNEYLLVLEDAIFNLEIRGLAVLGYSFSNKNKMECGFDYRASELISTDNEQQLWFNLGWYQSF